MHRTPCFAILARGDGRNAAADDVVLCRETPAAEGLLALVEQIETFLVTAYPEVVVLVFDDVVDEGGGKIEIAVAVFQLFHLVASLLDNQGSMFRGADIEVAIVVEGGIVDGYMILESTQVVTGIGYTPRSIVIVDDAIHADDEHGLRAMLDECHRGSVWRFEVFALHLALLLDESGEG